MRILKKMMAMLMLMNISIGILAFPVAAETTIVKHEGLEIKIEMDKEKYDAGEPITATITVRNTDTSPITIVNLAQLIPEGYRLADSSQSAMQNIELRPEQSMSLQVTFVGDPDQEEAEQGFLDKVLYGETLGVPNLLIAVVLTIAFIIFMILT